MAQYHFHLHDCGCRVEDEEGSVFPDQASARQHAILCARDVIAAEVLTGRLCLGCHIEIENECDKDVFLVSCQTKDTISKHFCLSVIQQEKKYSFY